MYNCSQQRPFVLYMCFLPFTILCGVVRSLSGRPPKSLNLSTGHSLLHNPQEKGRTATWVTTAPHSQTTKCVLLQIQKFKLPFCIPWATAEKLEHHLYISPAWNHVKVQRLPVEPTHQQYWGVLCLYDKQHTSCSLSYTATFACLHPPSHSMLCSLLG